MEWVRDDAVYIVRRRSTNKPYTDSHWVYNAWSRWSNCLLLQEASSLAEIVVWLCATTELLYSWFIESAAAAAAVRWRGRVTHRITCKEFSGPLATSNKYYAFVWTDDDDDGDDNNAVVFLVFGHSPNTNRHKYLRSLQFKQILDTIFHVHQV